MVYVKWGMLSCLRRTFQRSTNIWFQRSVLRFRENTNNAVFFGTNRVLATESLVELGEAKPVKTW
jgi:hypothetical protein